MNILIKLRMGIIMMTKVRVNKNSVCPYKQKVRSKNEQGLDFHYAYIYEQVPSASYVMQERLRQVERRVTKAHYDSIAKEDRLRVDLYDDPSEEWVMYVSNLAKVNEAIESDEALTIGELTLVINLIGEIEKSAGILTERLTDEANEEAIKENKADSDYNYFLNKKWAEDLSKKREVLMTEFDRLWEQSSASN